MFLTVTFSSAEGQGLEEEYITTNLEQPANEYQQLVGSCIPSYQ